MPRCWVGLDELTNGAFEQVWQERITAAHKPNLITQKHLLLEKISTLIKYVNITSYFAKWNNAK